MIFLLDNLPLLRVYLTVMPLKIKILQRVHFLWKKSNFEFGIWISLPAIEKISKQARQRGFTIWKNVDSTSGFMYGAGIIDDRFRQDIFNWLSAISLPGSQGQAIIKQAAVNYKLIRIK